MKPRIVTPPEAQAMLDGKSTRTLSAFQYAHTVATEPDRIAEAERRGAVKALRAFAAAHYRMEFARLAQVRADAIEKGADL